MTGFISEAPDPPLRDAAAQRPLPKLSPIGDGTRKI